MTIENKDAEYEFGDPITPYFIKPEDRMLDKDSINIFPNKTLTYFNEDTYCLEVWTLEGIYPNGDGSTKVMKGHHIVSIPYTSLWEGLKLSKWQPENENELFQS